MLQKPLLTIGVLLLFTACTTNVWKVNAIKYTNESFPPKPDSYIVKTIGGEVEQPHIVIGYISVKQKEFHMLSFEHRNPDSALRALKKRARELGADAIMNFVFYDGPGASGSGTAIKWK